jgi:iron complex outermembrane recepter protein
VMVKLDQQVGDKLTLSGDMVFSTRTNTQRNPVAIASSTGAAPAAQNITATVFGPGSGRGGQINPFYTNPTAVPGGTQQTIRVDLNELFPDGARQIGFSETFYGYARAEYELSDNWQVSAFALAGVNSSKATIIGSICQSCFLLALNGTTNGAGNLTQPSIPNTTTIVTQVPLTTANAIDVWNPRATNRTSPEVLRRLQDSRNYQASRQVMQQYNVTANGTLFSLPGGDVRVAVGGEYVRMTQNAEVVEPNNTGPSSVGSSFNAFAYVRNIKAAYGELLIPIISEDMNIPGVRNFVVNLSGRIDHYNEFGSIENPKFAFNWEVIDGLKIRGNYSTSFVAPQFSTYGPDRISGINGRSVDSFFGPQTGNINIDLAEYPEARAIPGPCSAPGATTCILQAAQGMRLDGANPEVTPSTGKTWAIGADFNPTFLPGFNASLTYWHTTIEGTSGGPPLGIVLYSDKFHDLLKIYPNGATPAEIEAYRGGRRQRSPLAAGTIYYGLDFRNFNVYTLYVEGIDFDVSYRHRFDWGVIRAGVNGTYKTKFDQTAFPGEPVFSVLNKNGFNGTFPATQLDARANLGVEVGPFKASAFVIHTGGYTYWGSTAANPVTTTNGSRTGGGDKVKAYTTVDMTASYDLSSLLGTDIEAFVNVDNVFDKMPPFVNVSGGYYGLITFPLGRVVTVGARVKF